MSHDDFVSKANSIHENKYHYPEKYIKAHQSIFIECRIHGIFKQKAYSHLAGHGCKLCANIQVKEKLKKSSEDFIAQCKVKHNYFYDYSKLEYLGTGRKVLIVCPIHGEFEQLAQHHLRGSKCPRCVPKKANKKLETFISQANLTHNNKYGYKNYLGAHIEVEIICPYHGSFLQTPNSHLRGRGCHRCQWSNSSRLEKKWLDSIGIHDEKRNKQLTIDDKLFKFDAYCSEANTIWEFYGDFWHGNPEKFNPKDVNKKMNKTFGELYNETMSRESLLLQKGFQLITIWEDDFLKQTKNKLL